MAGFDNEAFTKWLHEFEEMLIQSGMPRPQAMKYRSEYWTDAVAYFSQGDSPSDAVVKELLG